jgi:hypothetical protein
MQVNSHNSVQNYVHQQQKIETVSLSFSDEDPCNRCSQLPWVVASNMAHTRDAAGHQKANSQNLAILPQVQMASIIAAHARDAAKHQMGNTQHPKPCHDL